jgi:hypothetical protein
MKKILLLTDALNVRPADIDFAAFISAQGKSKLIALFVGKHGLDSTPSMKSLGGQMYVEEITEDVKDVERRNELIQKNINLFRERCMQRDINSVVRIISPEQIIDETRYADLIIAAPAFLANENEKKSPSKFVVELMSKAECPVLIAPEIFVPIDDVVLAYDGSRSSVFAIKQFYYLLPEFAGKHIHILHIRDDNASEKHEENPLFVEWLNMHSSTTSFVNLSGNPREMLFEYFMIHNEHNNKMLVSGAFGRNLLSSLFKPGTAELVLKSIDIPVFIAHH